MSQMKPSESPIQKSLRPKSRVTRLVPFTVVMGALAFTFGCVSLQGQKQADAQTADATKTETKAAPEDKPAKTYRVSEAVKLGPGAPADVVKRFDDATKEYTVPLPPEDMKTPDKATVVFETNKGNITVELDGKSAPLHVKSMLYLAGRNFYDGTSFHRRADLTGDGKGYIIQGGDPFTKASASRQFAGMGGPGYEIPLEISKLKHDQFVLAMARSQDPDSAGSQFYFTQGATHFLDKQYTVFGKVTEGKDVVSKLVQGDTLTTIKVLDDGKPAEAPETKPEADAPKVEEPKTAGQ